MTNEITQYIVTNYNTNSMRISRCLKAYIGKDFYNGPFQTVLLSMSKELRQRDLYLKENINHMIINYEILFYVLTIFKVKEIDF